MRRLLQLTFLLIVGIAFSGSLAAQENGIPFITNFSPKDYKAESQNWCFVQNEDGLIYVGNNMGVLEYDGVSWQLIPTKTVVRSLAIDEKDNRIYVGSISDLGYLEKKQTGNLSFVSLLDKIPEESREFNSIWATVATSEGVLFRATDRMFRWANNAMSLMKSSPIIYNLAGEPVYYDPEVGLVRPKGDKFIPIFDENVLADINVNTILPYGKDSWLIQSINGLLTVYSPNSEGDILYTLPANSTAVLSQNRVYRGAVSNKNAIGYTTLKGGVVFLDTQGNIQNVIDKNLGLQTNECYTLFEDNQENIWVGTGNGISKIEANAPISYFSDALGLDGGVILAVTRFENKLYAGGLGSFYLENGKFNPVLGSSQQVWNYLKFKTNTNEAKLLVSTSDGIGEIKQNQYVNCALAGETTRCFVQSERYPNRVYVGKSEGISVIEYDNGVFNNIANVPNFDLEVRNIIEDDKGVIWLGTEYDGTVKVDFTLSEDLENPKIEYFDKSKGLESMTGHRVYQFEGSLLSVNKAGIYKYNSEGNQFKPEERFGKELTNGERPVMYFIPDASGKIWLSAFKNNQYPIGFVQKKQSEYKWNDLILRRLPPMEVEVIYPEEDGIIWIGGTEGLFRYNSNIEKAYDQPYKALIRKITLNEDSVISKATQGNTGILEIPYALNNLTFSYAAASFEDAEALLFSYKLENFDDRWSEWAPETRKEYTLSEGKYVFSVKAKNIYGVESEPTTYSFKVLPPIYRSIFAYISYAVLALVFVYSLVYFNTKRFQAQNQKLEAIVEKRTLEIRQQNEELEQQKMEIISQRNDIKRQKDEIEKAYDNIQTISEVGQKITSTLDFEKLVKTIYKSVNQLLDAAAFGVGIFNERTNNLEFGGFIENGNELPFFSDEIHDETKLSSWCFNNLKPVIINDISKEFNNYVKGEVSTKDGEIPESAVYVPLIVENEPIGVITVQSFKQNAYSDLQLTIIQTLASYIAVAVDNAKAYEVIKANNADITDSIRYAETIQQAILPSKEKMNEALHEYFVLYKPKDIVSGDFYWFNHIEDKIFIAVTDCTGHGVPGAFMSIVGINLLNEIINVEKVHNPAKVLTLLNQYVTLSLRQHEVNNIDGMDIALIVLETHEDFTTTITFAGAKRPMYYFTNGELHRVEGVRKTIGGGKRISRKEREFVSKEITLQSDSSIYLLSDGYVDQNDINRQRFGSWKLKKLLSEIAPLPMHKQEEILNHYLLEHMRGTPQRDDITILGLRVI